ncbi:restriction endonuclease subunit S [Listeria welshimeri]
MPESWEWVRFSEVSTIVRGGSPRPIKEFITEADDGINWIKIGDTDKGGKFINSTKEKIKPSGLKKTRYVTKGTFLLTNSMSFGRPYILNVDGAIHDGWLAISNYEEVFSRDFLYYLLSSKVAYHQFLALISGAVVKNLNSDKVASLLVPVPPQKEQERIVSAIMVGLPKVDDYQKLHDRLEKINKELPEKLRKSILQYAMQGKLVPQDPNDEPVEVLLEKIRQEKQKLFEEGKLKKKDLQESIIYKGDDNSYYEKNGNSEVKLDDIPELPSTWEYARFKDIVSYYMGKTPPRSANEYWGDDIPWVSIADMPANGIITSTKEHVSHEAKKLFKDKISPAGTLLMSFKLTVGRVSLLGIEATHNEAIISIFPYADTDESLKMYLFKFLPQIANGGDSKDAIKGTTLNSQSINNLLIPMPPLEEQSRIIQEVAKFEDLIPQLG